MLQFIILCISSIVIPIVLTTFMVISVKNSINLDTSGFCWVKLSSEEGLIKYGEILSYGITFLPYLIRNIITYVI